MKNVKYKFAAVSVVAVTLVVSYFKPVIPAELMFGSYSYEALNMVSTGMINRLGLYSLSLLIVFSLVILIPKKRFSFTNLGQYTLYVYLLHGLFIQFIRREDLLQLNQNLDIIPLAVIAGTMVWFLSNKWVITLSQPIIEGKATLIQQQIGERKLPYHKEKTE
ncbi:hypothetical protein [Piscibacillus salipiscarius]|uniref:hypothetical protein n=1 Tax=Piscibacillus salipiscarius TaxID=299480 RepID=UPI0006CF8D65|nr:hypothetical protein [Piscibacillus salipiscarius]